MLRSFWVLEKDWILPYSCLRNGLCLRFFEMSRVLIASDCEVTTKSEEHEVEEKKRE